MKMKKICIVVLGLTMLFTFVSCGDDKSSEKSNKAEEVVKDNLDKAEEYDSYSVEAVEHYFSSIGLKVDDVKPAFDYSVGEYGAYADDPDSSSGHGVIIFKKEESEVSDDEYNEWLDKVFKATASVSQDGYNIIGYEFVSDGEDALSETTLEDAISGFLSGWSFRYNDKIMTVYVDRKYDNDKESQLGYIFYYTGVSVDIGVGLQKSFDDTMDEAESYMEENEKELEEYFD
ncbi:MAG: hypothetical protein IJA34_15500 [Lachnospiraceae bacterium]|nr:hypothetical protein [Lachnospiraceae bacterium]